MLDFCRPWERQAASRVETVFKESTLAGQSRVKCALPLGKSQAPCVVHSLGNVGPH